MWQTLRSFPNMAMGNIKMSLPDCSLSGCFQLPARHLVKSSAHLMGRFRRKLFSLHVPVHVTRQKGSRIVQKSAVCIQQNMRCSTNIKCITVKPMSFTWISVLQARGMMNSYAVRSRKTKCSIFEGEFRVCMNATGN